MLLSFLCRFSTSFYWARPSTRALVPGGNGLHSLLIITLYIVCLIYDKILEMNSCRWNACNMDPYNHVKYHQYAEYHF